MRFKSIAFSAVFLLMTPGKLKSDSLLVASVIVGTAALVVALTSLPAQARGPVIEHLRLEVTKQTSPC